MARQGMTVAALRRRAKELGALDAKPVAPSKVYTAAWVRMKCRYGCDGYGTSLLCPPRSPTPDETRRVLDGYRRALLIRGRKTADMRALVAALEREAFLSGHYKAFGYACGPCRLCRSCAFDRGCRHTEEARPAMEACGIDVFRTAREAGFPIEVVRDENDPQNYFALLLIA
jgi:predicted metal-binding protein